MSGPADLFREIHRLRKFAQEMQDFLDRAPRLLQTQKAKVARQEQIHKDEVEAIKKLKVGIHEKEGLLKSAFNQIARYQQQINDVSGKKEFEALQHEIAAARATCQKLEDEILASIGETEEHSAKVPELQKAVDKMRQEAAHFEKTQAERKIEQTAQLQETLARLKEVEQQIPEQYLELYNRIVNAMGADGLAALNPESRTCSNCFTTVTAQKYNELVQKAFYICNCGRILYLPEMPASDL